MYLLLALLIPFASFILQSYPRLINKLFGVDVWTRLLEIEHVKKAGHKIPGKITHGFIIDGHFDYPIIFPWIFSFFSKKTLLKIQGFVSPFFDALQNVLVFYITYSLTNRIEAALLAQLIYSLIPMIPIENSYLTPRSLGYFNFTLAFYPTMLFVTYGNPWMLFVGLFFTTTLFLTHRFALQSLLILSIFFSFVDQTFIYSTVFVVGFITATLLTKGYYLRVAKGHLYNIYFWVVNYTFRFAHQIYGIRDTKKQDWVGQIYALLSVFSPIFMFGINVWIVSAFVYIYLHIIKAENFVPDPILYKMSLWILFFYVFGAVVLKVKRLIPIGEGQRYLEMATVPAAVLSSVLYFYLFEQFGIIIAVLFALLAIGNLGLIITIQIKGIIKDKNRSLTHELQTMFEYINKLAEKTPRIMCIPHQITTMTVYNTKADVLVNADNPGLMKLSDFFPILQKPITEIAKKYDLDYLLMRESFVKLSDLKLKKPNIIFTSGDIHLIKL